MRPRLLLSTAAALCVLLAAPFASAQTYYTVASLPGASIPSGGSLVPGSLGDDVSAPLLTPFDFCMAGANVPSGTAISVSTNGVVMFAAAASAGFSNQALPATNLSGANSLSSPAVFVLWDDWLTTGVTNGGIYTNLVGSAPNRQWIIEWRARKFGEGSGEPNANFAAVFSEGSCNFETRYVLSGADAAAAGASATVGVQSTSTGPSTQFSLNTASVPNGTVLRWTWPGTSNREVPALGGVQLSLLALVLAMAGAVTARRRRK